MPAWCRMAPEMPMAMYSWGETVVPVWPTGKLVRVPAGVGDRAGRADGGAEGIGELFDQPEPVRGADPAAAGDHDRRLGQFRGAGRFPGRSSP